MGGFLFGYKIRIGPLWGGLDNRIFARFGFRDWRRSAGNNTPFILRFGLWFGFRIVGRRGDHARFISRCRFGYNFLGWHDRRRRA
jgi:hypothetical protein